MFAIAPALRTRPSSQTNAVSLSPSTNTSGAISAHTPRGADSGNLIAMALAVDCAVDVTAALASTQTAAVLYGMRQRGPFARLGQWNDANRSDRERALERVRVELGNDEFERNAALGAAMSYDEALDYTLYELDRLLAEIENP